MSTNSLMVQQILDILDVLTSQLDHMPMADLEILERGMTVSLKEKVVEAIARKQINATYQGYALDPILPDSFFSTPNEDRPESHLFWSRRPYIETRGTINGTIYWVHCLDGGAWDRPTWWGEAKTLEAAAKICRNGPNW